jgi:hypothetical protein
LGVDAFPVEKIEDVLLVPLSAIIQPLFCSMPEELRFLAPALIVGERR